MRRAAEESLKALGEGARGAGETDQAGAAGQRLPRGIGALPGGVGGPATMGGVSLGKAH